MKKSVLSSALLAIFTFCSIALAASFSSFKGDQYYIAEGRWFSVNAKFFFKINEGNANEETLSFLENPNKLSDKVKYKLCFKINKSCQLNCTGESIRQIKELRPWEDVSPMVARSDGSYVETSEKACKESL